MEAVAASASADVSPDVSPLAEGGHIFALRRSWSRRSFSIRRNLMSRRCCCSAFSLVSDSARVRIVHDAQGHWERSEHFELPVTSIRSAAWASPVLIDHSQHFDDFVRVRHPSGRLSLLGGIAERLPLQRYHQRRSHAQSNCGTEKVHVARILSRSAQCPKCNPGAATRRRGWGDEPRNNRDQKVGVDCNGRFIDRINAHPRPLTSKYAALS